MNRKFLFVTIGVVAVLVVAAFWAGKTIAATNCFSDTNGHWAETYICWLKDHQITFGYGDGTYRPDNAITRGEMAAMLERQAEVPPDSGAILITPGRGNWMNMLASYDVVFNLTNAWSSVVKATAGGAWIVNQPSVPTVLYGRKMQLVGVDFCYRATTNTYLDTVLIETYSSTVGDQGFQIQYQDTTHRTDTACRNYTLTTPYTLTKYDDVEFYIYIQWNTGGTDFDITRTTFIFQPTDFMYMPFKDVAVP